MFKGIKEFITFWKVRKDFALYKQQKDDFDLWFSAIAALADHKDLVKANDELKAQLKLVCGSKLYSVLIGKSYGSSKAKFTLDTQLATVFKPRNT